MLYLATNCDKLLSNFNNEFTCSVFLDLSKAFDTINHDISIETISYILGIKSKIVFIIKSYLSNRNQCARIKNVSSDLTTLKFGVLQSLILRPLLFVL